MLFTLLSVPGAEAEAVFGDAAAQFVRDKIERYRRLLA
jgi:hypothetical protein